MEECPTCVSLSRSSSTAIHARAESVSGWFPVLVRRPPRLIKQTEKDDLVFALLFWSGVVFTTLPFIATQTRFHHPDFFARCSRSARSFSWSLIFSVHCHSCSVEFYCTLSSCSECLRFVVCISSVTRCYVDLSWSFLEKTAFCVRGQREAST